MKGYLIFGGLTVSIGLLAATLSYMDHRRKAHSSTLVGALAFVEETIEASGSRCGILQPLDRYEIKPRPLDPQRTHGHRKLGQWNQPHALHSRFGAAL